MFKIKKNREDGLYVYLNPTSEQEAQYEIMDEETLRERYDAGALQEGCRLFKVDKEIKVTFERVIHLD